MISLTALTSTGTGNLFRTHGTTVQSRELTIQVKTHGLSSKNALIAAIRRDVAGMQGIENERLSGVTSKINGSARITFRPGYIKAKGLVVGIPANQVKWLGSPAFRSAILALQRTSRTLIRVVPVKRWKR